MVFFTVSESSNNLMGPGGLIYLEFYIQIFIAIYPIIYLFIFNPKSSHVKIAWY